MLELIHPRQEFVRSYCEMCREFKENNFDLTVRDPDAFAEWEHTLVQEYEDMRLGRNLPEGWVPASTFWLVENGRVVAVGSLRHRLTPALERFGGHIGYGVRMDCWNKGYGTKLLKLVLEEAKALGIGRVLITCDEKNIGSARVMEKNGAIWQDTIDDIIDGKPRRTKRYWIKL